MKRWIYLALIIILISCGDQNTVKFAVCADVHNDMIHDGMERLTTFVKQAEKEDADFIIQLGDFCLPFEQNEPFLEKWNSFGGEKFHVLGNHDSDVSPKNFTQNFWGMNKSFYSFDRNGFHFVVLDANYLKEGKQFNSFSNGNYAANSADANYIPPQQIDWLRKDLQNTDKPTIVFSHHSLAHWGGIKNREEIRSLFVRVNKNQKKIIACFSGHDHIDRYDEIDGIHYIGINSMSYAWGGNRFTYSGRFDKEIEGNYPRLKYTLPYRDPLYATVKVNSNGTITISGKQSAFIAPGPDDLGAGDHDYSASISDRILKF